MLIQDLYVYIVHNKSSPRSSELLHFGFVVQQFSEFVGQPNSPKKNTTCTFITAFHPYLGTALSAPRCSKGTKSNHYSLFMWHSTFGMVQLTENLVLSKSRTDS